MGRIILRYSRVGGDKFILSLSAMPNKYIIFLSESLYSKGETAQCMNESK